MRAVVCCKAVVTDATPDSVHVLNDSLQSDSSDLYINELDEYALEAALALKKTYNAETWAITVGPLRSQEALYIALAKGIDNVTRISSDTSRPELIALSLTSALKGLQPNLVLVGVQSEDWMGGEVGTYIAEGLGASLGFAVVDITEVTDTHVRVKKEIAGGRKVDMKFNLPAVLCVQSGIRPLQYVSALRRKKVRDIPIKQWGKLEDIEIPPNIKNMLKYQVQDVAAPESGSQAVMISGDKVAKAKGLLELLKKNLSL